MTASPPTTGRERARRELGLVWATALVLAAGLGLGVAFLREESFWLVFGVFTACFLPPSLGLAWLLLGAGRRVRPDPHVEENVESRWMDKAAAGALLDTIGGAGLAAGVLSVFELSVDASLALLGVVAVALADGGLRYLVLARREA
jgi:hypothetical protein